MLCVLLIPRGAPLTEALAHPDPEAAPDQAMPAKSIAFYVGRNLTEDGSVLLGGFGHEPSSHWYEITPARDVGGRDGGGCAPRWTAG